MPRTIKLAAVDDGHVLLVFKGSTGQWSFPGGKVRKGKESDTQTLRRELKEEVPKLKVRRLRRWRRFNCVFRGERFTITIYFGKASGPLRSRQEIDAAAWVRNWRRIPLSANTRRILDVLAKRGYLQR